MADSRPVAGGRHRKIPHGKNHVNKIKDLSRKFASPSFGAMPPREPLCGPVKARLSWPIHPAQIAPNG
jgi:hypothetical protein